MNNILLWSGIAVSGGALMIAAFFFVVYRIRSVKLEKTLDNEYGERKKPSGK